MEEVKNVYLIKDLAQITGVSVDSIKYYYKMGLLREQGRSPGTNFRYFNDTAVQALQKIRGLRAEGRSLKEIGALLAQEHHPS